MNKYLFIIEKSRNGYSAYCPDLPGCVAAAATKKETENLMMEAIEFHLEGMMEEGLEIPKPSISDVNFYKFNLKAKQNNLVTV